MKWLRDLPRAAFIAALVLLVAIPATGAQRPADRAVGLAHLSQSVQFHYYLTHPNLAPPQLAPAIAAANQLRRSVGVARAVSPTAANAYDAARFNLDDVGFPQNEEAVSVCQSNPNVVVGGTNDYRGLLDPEGNFTGWQLSTNSGSSVAKEGLLPSLPSVGSPGTNLPSEGDPVVQSRGGCRFYFGSLNFPIDPTNGPNGIGVYTTTGKTLRNCPPGTDPDQLTQPACFEDGRLVAEASQVDGGGHFLDKPWLDVGRSGDAGRVVWVVYSDFATDPNAPLGFTGAQIKAVRCTADLTDCTDPILISGTDEDVQFGDVTIADDGSVLVTWVQVQGELEQTAQTFTIKARTAAPGSTTFGPTHVVAEETNAIPFGGFLHAADYRVATAPKSIMPIVGGQPRPIVVWDRCAFRLFDTVCEEPQIRMSWSTDGGTTWHAPKVISASGDNIFPAISDDGSRHFVVAYYTSRFDRRFHHDYDVEMVTIDRRNGAVVNRQRVTPFSNDPDADPLLGGFFIGDYFDVHLLGGRAWVDFNANVHHMRILGTGLPIPQQDNFLIRTHA